MGLVKSGMLRAGRRFSENAETLTERYPIDSRGRFGENSKHRNKSGRIVRVIQCDNPAREALDFVMLASKSPAMVRIIKGKGAIYTMRDGAVITYRRVSSSNGTPVVELNILGSGPIVSQKIHFIQKEHQHDEN